MKNIFLAGITILSSSLANAQENKADTVKVPLAKSSNVVFTVQDRSDLETLKHYDFNKLFQDIIARLEKYDSIPNTNSEKSNEVVKEKKECEIMRDSLRHNRHKWWQKDASQTLNLDLGMNNFASNGKFPDSNNEKYAVKPWGSWYFGISSIQRSRLAKKFYLEWGGGVSWYNFKFQDEKVLMQKDDTGVSFTDDPRFGDPTYNFSKSKLTVTYINASLVPIIDFGDNKTRKRMSDGQSDSFRIGLGPYVGYRIGSYAKQVYKKDGDTKKEHDKDSFYLNNLRYGARLQIGYRSTDFFFNYDMNKLFATNKGPDLNAFSFGIIF